MCLGDRSCEIADCGRVVDKNDIISVDRDWIKMQETGESREYYEENDYPVDICVQCAIMELFMQRAEPTSSANDVQSD